MEKAQQQVEEAIQGTEEELLEPPMDLTPEEKRKLDEQSRELQQQVVDQSGTEERTTTLEKIIRVRKTMSRMENRRIAEEAFQKAFDEALNRPIEKYKCIMGYALYGDGKCQCWKETPNQPSRIQSTPTNYFTGEPTPHENNSQLLPTQILLTQEIEIEDFKNMADLTKSEIKEIDKKMEKIAREAKKGIEEKRKTERKEKRGLEG
jgi:hypothetical protein